MMSIAPIRSTAPQRVSSMVLLTGLIAGRFDLARFSPTLAVLDIRMVFAIAACLATLLLSTTRPTVRRSVPSRFLLLLSLWFAWLLLGAAWAPTGARLDEYVADIGYLAVFLLCTLVTLVHFDSRDWLFLWKVILVIAVVYFLGAVAAGPGDQGRYSAFGGGPNVFVRIMGLGAIAALLIHLRTLNVLVLGLLPIFAAGAVLSGSRGGLVAAASIAVIAVPALFKRLGWRRSFGFSVLVLGGGVISFIAFGSALTRVFEQRVVLLTLVDGYSSGRSEIVAAALDLFRQHPFIGVGLDGYYGLVGQYAGLEYPHNLFLAAAAEGGLIGLVLLLLPLTFVATCLLRGRPLTAVTLCAWLASLFMLVSSMFSGDYYDSRFIWFFAIAALSSASAAAGSPERGRAKLNNSAKSLPRITPL
ncbi:O-antigen ligase [Frigoribacterium sp. PhB24]|uniref:O-antigen ligase family protein n=1 Tax=Frigoribacterium sp. PhB24 TaxID=2485204 RepID=UPI000FC06088|nr:O-antigen ligase family protein [Frigoribacterium sp. PhB24]ROS54737.1 O-antigen ligase [Frigoribacterium sp. PhB24]